MKGLDRPAWIRGKVAWDKNYSDVKELLRSLNLHSVCDEAACPNRGECWQKRHVTFLIMGRKCTRNCLFCNVLSAKPEKPDPHEPENVARAVRELGAEYIVITSVTRDDITDKGAGHFFETVREIKKENPLALVELLIPDFGAEKGPLEKVAFSEAVVIGHNIEVPRALYAETRPGADYDRSLEVLKALDSHRKSGADIFVKSAMILGLGEPEDEVLGTLEDLKGAGVDIVYLGQYLRPSPDHWPVKKYYTPGEFDRLGEAAEKMGFRAVFSGPMVRSSYRARASYEKCLQC